MTFKDMPDEELNKWIAQRRGWTVKRELVDSTHDWVKTDPTPNRNRTCYRSEKEAWDDGPRYCEDMNDAVKLLQAIQDVDIFYYTSAKIWTVKYPSFFSKVKDRYVEHEILARAIAEVWADLFEGKME